MTAALGDAMAAMDPVLAALAKASEDAVWRLERLTFMALQSRMRREAGLGGRERAFATLTIDVVYGTLDDTFRIHATRALNAGADRETIREAICFTAQFGAARTWDALRALKGVFAALDHEAAAATSPRTIP